MSNQDKFNRCQDRHDHMTNPDYEAMDEEISKEIDKELKELAKVYTFRGFYIPTRMMDSLTLYITQHKNPGDFLSAVLKNDIQMAVSYGDDENLRNLPAYIGFLYNKAPHVCWGSEEAFNEWIRKGK